MFLYQQLTQLVLSIFYYGASSSVSHICQYLGGGSDIPRGAINPQISLYDPTKNPLGFQKSEEKGGCLWKEKIIYQYNKVRSYLTYILFIDNEL